MTGTTIFKLSNGDRAKIKSKAIINRLQRTAMGEDNMSALQIKCAEILLKKSMPDLTAVAIEDNGPKGNQTVMNINLGGANPKGIDAKTVETPQGNIHSLNLDLAPIEDDADEFI